MKKYPYSLIALATVLSIIFFRYRFAISDQCIYIPIIRKILDSSLYPGDHLFNQPSGKYTIVLPIVAYLSKLFTIRWVFFVGYIAVIFAVSWAIYKCAFSFFKNRDVACIALLLLCISRRADQAIITQEGFFTLQPVAAPFSLLALCFFIDERYTLAVAFNAIAILIHPISAAPCFLLLATYLAINSYRLGWRAILRMAGVFLLITSPVSLRAIMSRGSSSHGLNFLRMASAEWMNILYGRNTYAFPALWNHTSWVHLRSIVVLLVVSMFLKIMYVGMDRRDWKALWIVIASLASLGMAHLFGSVIPIPLFFGLQMARGLYMLMYVAFIYAAYVAWSGYQSGRLSMNRGIAAVVSAAAIATGEPRLMVSGILTSVIIWLATKPSNNVLKSAIRVFGILMAGVVVYFSLVNFVFAVIVCVPIALLIVYEILKKIKVIEGKPIYRWVAVYILFIAVFTAKVHKDGLQVNSPLQNPDDEWTQVQYWAAENTPKDAMFIVPWDTAGFRNFSRRPIVADVKDGAPGLFSESYDIEWARRRGQFQSNASLKDEDFVELAKEYKASYVVTRSSHQLGFPRVYEGRDFHVYTTFSHTGEAFE